MMVYKHGTPRFRSSATAATLQSRLARVFLLSLLLLIATPSPAGEPAQGDPAPALLANLIGGGKFDLAAERGKVVVLNFWASWCEPCLQEMPALDAYYQAHKETGLEVIGISVDSQRDLGKVLDAARKVNFPIALISDAEASGYGRIWRVPITFVIDRRGVLRFSGWKFADKLDHALLDKFVSPLLRESNPGPRMLTQRSGQ
jgi:cytochrome c biogenesis protein CcmG, thiol:disulfide interchange protein DsbE